MGVVVAVVVLALAATRSAGLKCKPQNCALLQCGVPLCPPGFKLGSLPCSCCPGCVPDPDDQQEYYPALERDKRKIGSRQRLAKQHRHLASGFNGPSGFEELLRKLERQKQGR